MEQFFYRQPDTLCRPKCMLKSETGITKFMGLKVRVAQNR